MSNLKINGAWICHHGPILVLDIRIPSSCWWEPCFCPTASSLNVFYSDCLYRFLTLCYLSYRFIISWSCLPTGPMWKMLAECKNMRILNQRRNKSYMIFILLALKNGSMLTHKRNLVLLPNMWMLCCLTKGHPTILKTIESASHKR